MGLTVASSNLFEGRNVDNSSNADLCSSAIANRPIFEGHIAAPLDHYPSYGTIRRGKIGSCCHRLQEREEHALKRALLCSHDRSKSARGIKPLHATEIDQAWQTCSIPLGYAAWQGCSPLPE